MAASFGDLDELTVLPFVAIGGAAVDGFAELGAGQYGRVHPFGDLLPLPLGEHPQQVEKHPAAGGARVNGFGEGNEVGVGAC